MIDCTTAVSQLWDYLEKEVDESQREGMEEHLAFCKRCCGEVEFADELRGVLKKAAEPRIPDEVAEKLESFIEEIEGQQA